MASGVASRASRAVESATVNIGFLGKLELGDSVELDETYGVVSAKQRVTGFEHRLSPVMSGPSSNSAGQRNANSLT